jgi:general secretion pathway protein H
MVVMAIMALLIGLVAPNLIHSWERAGARANIRKLATALRLARSEAATRDHPVRLYLNLKADRFYIEGSRRQGELKGLRLVRTQMVWENSDKTQGYVTFYGDGSSSGGKMILEESTGQRYLIEIHPITGRVELSMLEK